MSVLVNKNTKVICQGFTGKHGEFHSRQAIEYGTNLFGEVHQKRVVQNNLIGPVFNPFVEAKAKVGPAQTRFYFQANFIVAALLEALMHS